MTDSLFCQLFTPHYLQSPRGGEFLLSPGPSYENISGAEARQPNIQLCMEKLVPLGIQVYPVKEDVPLPMADDSFDIVINRHESCDLHEIGRILKPGGMFITQQVGGENGIAPEKRNNIEIPLHQAFSAETELPEFHDCGFSVNYSNERFPRLKFRSDCFRTISLKGIPVYSRRFLRYAAGTELTASFLLV